MQTIILADRNDESLRPLNYRTSVALLPVVGKPVIEFCIEALHDAAIDSATIIVNARDRSAADILGTGARWGMDLKYVFSEGDQDIAELAAGVYGDRFDERLVVRGDMLWNADIGQILKRVQSTAHTNVSGTSGGIGVMSWCRHSNLGQGAAYASPEVFSPDAVFEVSRTDINRLASINDFHRANVELLASGRSNRRPRGRDLGDGLIRDFDSQAKGAVLRHGRASVGRRSRIHHSVRLDGNVVIGDRVVVDRNVTLENTVVLPDTYIGEWVSLKNALVQGNTIVRVDTGMTMQVNDELLLMDLCKEARWERKETGSGRSWSSLNTRDNAGCGGAA